MRDPRQGIGEVFQMDEMSGTGSLTIPIRLSPGRDGLTPELMLSHAAASFDQGFGQGWSLSVKSITRLTGKHLPTYQDETESDGFAVPGIGEIVPKLSDTGLRIKRDAQDYTVFPYRPKFAGDTVLIERWVRKQDKTSWWKLSFPDGSVEFYGKEQNSRIDHPSLNASLSWLLSYRVEATGNAISYEYKRENSQNVDQAALHEVGRKHHLNGLYLKRINYGNTKPVKRNGEELNATSWLFEVVLDYGEHDGPDFPSNKELKGWKCRKDSRSTYNAGFEQRIYRQCERILMFHKFEELGDEPCLVGETNLMYELTNAHSFLTAVGYTGYKKLSNGQYQKKSIPNLEIDYITPQLGTNVEILDLANMPVGIDDLEYSFIDLYGDGTTGVLCDIGDAWYYKRNLGGGKFGALELVGEKPSIMDDKYQLLDVTGDGRQDFVLNSSGVNGYYERNTNGGWKSFQPFNNAINFEDGYTRKQYTNLAGFNKPGWLVEQPGQALWFEFRDKEGYAPPVVLPALDKNGPPGRISDPAQGIMEMDLSGDGLADIVRIKNGCIHYWPNLGYGRFGDNIKMSNSPVFDDHQPDLRRIRFADLTGSGTTDILYLGTNRIQYWLNEAGNGWSDAYTLPVSFPNVSDLTKVSIADLHQNGTLCLIWSNSAPVPDNLRLHYIQLNTVPHFGRIRAIRNNLGRQTVIRYRSSREFYLEDVNTEHNWISTIPYHSSVVSQVEEQDLIGKSKLVQRFKYHHGCFSKESQQFVGFALVEKLDTEAFVEGTYSRNDYTAPSLIKTWYHTGLYEFDSVYTSQIKNGFNNLDNKAHGLPMVSFNLKENQNWQTAYSRLIGQTIRSEVYNGDQLYSTEEYTVELRSLQDQTDVFDICTVLIPSESIRYLYDGNLLDPRIDHSFTLQTDRFGLPNRTCQIAYPRRKYSGNAQDYMHVTVSDQKVAYHAHEDAWFLHVPIESKSFEIGGLTPDQGDYLSQRELIKQINVALLNDRSELSIVEHNAPQSRIKEWQQHIYWNTETNSPHPLGKANLPILPHVTNKAYISDKLATQTLGVLSTLETLRKEAGYTKNDGFWWQNTPKQYYANSEGYYAQTHEIDAFGAKESVEYDRYTLFPSQSTNALGGESKLEIDYAALKPWRLVDMNGNVEEKLFDALGVTIVETAYGTEWDDATQTEVPVGHEPLKLYVSQPSGSTEDVVKKAATYVQKAGKYTHYDLYAWQRDQQPLVSISLNREEYARNRAQSDVLVSLSYTDGFGRSIQTKQMSESGLAYTPDDSGKYTEQLTTERWLNSGRSRYNNKGAVVKQFEPFYSGSWRYESVDKIAEIGTSTTKYYDSIGRQVKEDMPNGLFTKIEHAAWQVKVYDAIDTVEDSLYSTLRQGLPDNDPDKDAFNKAKKHANTPTIELLDGLGRSFETQKVLTDGSKVTTSKLLNGSGLPLQLKDERGLLCGAYIYTLNGTAIQIQNLESGKRTFMYRTDGKQLVVLMPGGYRFEFSYDLLGRTTQTKVLGNGLNHIISKGEFGETQPNAKAKNLIGKPYKSYHSGGVNWVEAYKFTGEPVARKQQLITNYKEVVDWDQTVSLDSEIYKSFSTENAVGQPIEIHNSDGSVHIPTYNKEGNLTSLSVRGLTPGSSAETIIKNISYNARGQQTSLQYGNGVSTAFTYDPDLHTPKKIHTSIGQGTSQRVFQNLHYYFDPAGKITQLRDKAFGQLITNSAFSESVLDYTYDELGQLIKASGLVHAGVVKGNGRKHNVPPQAFKGTKHLGLNNGQVIERYERRYTYDTAGNLSSMTHKGQTNTWVTKMWVDSNSNKAIETTDANGNTILDPLSRFDSRGNLTKFQHLRNVEWNHLNQLAKAVIIERSNAPDDAEYYVYDQGGNRVKKVTERLVNGKLEIAEKRYLDGYDISLVRTENTLKSEKHIKHISLEDKRVATVIRNIQGNPSGPELQIRYQLNNHLGSSSLELNEKAEIISYETYFPYGGSAFIAGNKVKEVNLKTYRYSGKERDDSTGFYYYGQRYYAPWLRRWFNPDPGGFVDGLNLYRFVQGNPVNLVDVDGMRSQSAGYNYRVSTQSTNVNSMIRETARRIGATGWTGGRATVYKYRNKSGHLRTAAFLEGVQFYKKKDSSHNNGYKKRTVLNFDDGSGIGVVQYKGGKSPNSGLTKGSDDKNQIKSEGMGGSKTIGKSTDKKDRTGSGKKKDGKGSGGETSKNKSDSDGDDLEDDGGTDDWSNNGQTGGKHKKSQEGTGKNENKGKKNGSGNRPVPTAPKFKGVKPKAGAKKRVDGKVNGLVGAKGNSNSGKGKQKGNATFNRRGSTVGGGMLKGGAGKPGGLASLSNKINWVTVLVYALIAAATGAAIIGVFALIGAKVGAIVAMRIGLTLMVGAGIIAYFSEIIKGFSAIHKHGKSMSLGRGLIVIGKGMVRAIGWVFGITPLYDGITGVDAWTGKPLGSDTRSKMLGGAIGGILTAAGGSIWAAGGVVAWGRNWSRFFLNSVGRLLPSSARLAMINRFKLLPHKLSQNPTKTEHLSLDGDNIPVYPNVYTANYGQMPTASIHASPTSFNTHGGTQFPASMWRGLSLSPEELAHVIYNSPIMKSVKEFGLRLSACSPAKLANASKSAAIRFLKKLDELAGQSITLIAPNKTIRYRKTHYKDEYGNVVISNQSTQWQIADQPGKYFKWLYNLFNKPMPPRQQGHWVKIKSDQKGGYDQKVLKSSNSQSDYYDYTKPSPTP